MNLTRPLKDGDDIWLLIWDVVNIGDSRECRAKVKRDGQAVVRDVSEGLCHDDQVFPGR